MTLAQWVAKREQSWSPREHFLVGTSALTYGDLLEQSLRFCGLLKNLLPTGGTLALATSSDTCTAVVLWATIRAGYPLLLIDPHTSSSELAQNFADLHIDILLVDEDLRRDWDQWVGRVVKIAPPRSRGLLARLFGRVSPSQETFPACLDNVSPSRAVTDVSDEATALFFSTSGTTGRPKLVPVTRKCLMSQGKTIGQVFDLGSQAHLLNLLPTSHYDGLVMGPWLCLWNGATLVRDRTFSLTRILDMLDRVYHHQVSHLIGVPTVWSLLVRSPEEVRRTFNTEYFRMFISTAAPLADGIWRDLESHSLRPVVNVYGLTETGNLLFAGPDATSRQVGSVGVARGCRVSVRDEQGQEVIPGQIGELWLAGETVFSGYLGESPLDGIWFATGDLARIDENGITYICGRKKDIIIVGGLNVWPAEVDQALLRCPGVKDAATIGLAEGHLGEQVASAVVLEEGVTIEQVDEQLRLYLTSWKVPSVLKMVEQIPRGRTGKVQRDVLLSQLATPQAGQRYDNSVEERVLCVAASVLKLRRDQVDVNTSPETLSSWSSLTHLELVTRVEASFKITLTPGEVMRISTLGDVAMIVRSHVS